MNDYGQSGSGVTPLDALVLGGGGPVGVAWTSGMLFGLESAGLPLSESGLVVGTSAGSVAGAWLTMDQPGLQALPGLMQKRAAWHAKNAGAGLGDRSLLRRLAGGGPDDPDRAVRIGRAAIAAIPPISVDEAEHLWEQALPTGPFPPQLRIVAVNAETGAARGWSASDNIPLGVAVSCSTAAPGAAPPVTVAGSVWIDGGVRSGTNADLLLDPDWAALPADSSPGRVLVLAPMPSEALAREQAALAEHGHHVRVIVAEPFYETPLDLLDPRFVDIAAAAGTNQAKDISDDLANWWNQ
ncbi:patatin-like phospholipase family protein [Kribbella sp. NPDC005582]|uniref:patatin-like phospholipase family protein n=1 Tax=Kribbella sp. NPDC005582 TaxID=3156893 RepID=UPI0033AB9B7B